MTGPEGTLPAGVRPLIPGDPPAVGDYPLLGRLGAGGMGIVYLGHHPDHGLVAVKILRTAYQVPAAVEAGAEARPEGRDGGAVKDGRPARPGRGDLPDLPGEDDLRRRFRAEVDFARRVASCATARVIEDGTGATRPYIVTEYIQGPPLHKVVGRTGPLPAGRLESVALGVTAALVAIHRAGLVHRDVKPANLLLAPTGPRVIDFGLATDQNVSGGPTQVGVVMGSPGWIAPERLAGLPATAASDVFGWGCLVAYAGTGRHPFGAGGADEITERIMHAEPDLAGLAAGLRGPVAAALAKDPRLRPTAGELLRMLLVPLLQGHPPPGDDMERIAATMIAKIWRPPADLDAEAAGPTELADPPEPGEPGEHEDRGDRGDRGDRRESGDVGEHKEHSQHGQLGQLGESGGRSRAGRSGTKASHTGRRGSLGFLGSGAFGWTAVGWSMATAVLVAVLTFRLDAGGNSGGDLDPGPDRIVSPIRPGRSTAPGPGSGADRAVPTPPSGVTSVGDRSPSPAASRGTGSPAPTTPVPTSPAETTPPPASSTPAQPPGRTKKPKPPRPHQSVDD